MSRTPFVLMSAITVFLSALGCRSEPPVDTWYDAAPGVTQRVKASGGMEWGVEGEEGLTSFIDDMRTKLDTIAENDASTDQEAFLEKTYTAWLADAEVRLADLRDAETTAEDAAGNLAPLAAYDTKQNSQCSVTASVAAGTGYVTSSANAECSVWHPQSLTVSANVGSKLDGGTEWGWFKPAGGVGGRGSLAFRGDRSPPRWETTDARARPHTASYPYCPSAS